MRLKSLILIVAFLSMASLAVAESAPVPAAGSDAPIVEQLPAGLTTPEANFLTGCSASLTCGDGNTASCTGNNSCSTTINAAICDGVTHRCPNYCIVYEQCYCGGTLQCQSNVGACSTGDDTVTCDGRTFNCPNFCL